MMLVDLLVHTQLTKPSGASPGGVLSHREAIQLSRAAGLDALCFTERLFPTGVKEALAAGREENFPVFVGVDIPVFRGRLLFLPYHPEDPEFLEAPWAEEAPLLPPEELANILAPHGVVIAVTPYSREPGRLPMGDRVFLIENLHAVAAITARSSEDPVAEALAVEAAGARGLTVVGGSDVTDNPSHIGQAATLLRFPVTSQAQLCELIKSGDAWSAQIGRAPAPVRHEPKSEAAKPKRAGRNGAPDKKHHDRRRSARR